MIEYTPRIDEQISAELRLRGRVAADAIPGIPEEDGVELLRRYLDIHRDQSPLCIEDDVLTFDVPPPSGLAAESNGLPPGASPAHVPPPVMSPVDQVLAQSGSKSLLDTPTIGRPVNKALWLLPLSLGFVGGLISWAVARDNSERIAKQMLVLGVVVQIVSVVVGFAMAPMIEPLMGTMTDAVVSAQWPPSASGRPTFYYFGTAT